MYGSRDNSKTWTSCKKHYIRQCAHGNVVKTAMRHIRQRGITFARNHSRTTRGSVIMCHLIGRYHGPAHLNCNYKNSLYIPIIFHNLSGYDARFIIKEIVTAYEGHVDVLPITKEKYISFTKYIKDIAKRTDSRKCIKLRFIDSFKFLSTSLDKLASFLSKDKLKIIRSKFLTLSDEEFELLTRKGSFHTSTFTASKNCRTRAYHRANYFTVRR